MDDGRYSENRNVLKAERTSTIWYSEWGTPTTNKFGESISVTQYSGLQVSVLKLQANSMMVHC